MSSTSKIPSSVKARKYKYNYPNTSPVIYSLSPTESLLNNYTVCYINGLNFSKSNTTGNSTVTFGGVTNIPVIFYNPSYISFEVPLNNISTGTYNIQVFNNANSYSNTVNYTLT